ncbi:MAG: tRNA pseudouridine(55) synthase TruB [Rhodocyclaceae bacterium]|nr:tRNA pseudouridine(55) synthase TruB [Rhodocyclaceae bacterium]MDZ4215154.1 tRNA pseudouridine(55) synthase TruB [Rhodocyclaceae bacterium]
MNKPRRAPRRCIDGVLLLDKPIGMTSNGALQKVRWLFNAEKAGHTGTLDPLATGVLPICLGEATKFSGELLDAGKAYRATVQLGVITATADAEGVVLATAPVTSSEADLRAVLPRFIGEIEQVPPMYSALKRDGRPLYELARQGIEVERAPRKVTIESIELLSWHGDHFVIDVDCSKGTYIRTLAADIGHALGCGAHLAALRRTRVGRHDLSGTVDLSSIESLAIEQRDALLLPCDILLSGLPAVTLGEREATTLLHGQTIRWSGVPSQQHRLYGPTGFLGLGECVEDGWLKPKRLIATISPSI